MWSEVIQYDKWRVVSLLNEPRRNHRTKKYRNFIFVDFLPPVNGLSNDPVVVSTWSLYTLVSYIHSSHSCVQTCVYSTGSTTSNYVTLNIFKNQFQFILLLLISTLLWNFFFKFVSPCIFDLRRNCEIKLLGIKTTFNVLTLWKENIYLHMFGDFN